MSSALTEYVIKTRRTAARQEVVLEGCRLNSLEVPRYRLLQWEGWKNSILSSSSRSQLRPAPPRTTKTPWPREEKIYHYTSCRRHAPIGPYPPPDVTSQKIIITKEGVVRVHCLSVQCCTVCKYHCAALAPVSRSNDINLQSSFLSHFCVVGSSPKCIRWSVSPAPVVCCSIIWTAFRHSPLKNNKTISCAHYIISAADEMNCVWPTGTVNPSCSVDVPSTTQEMAKLYSDLERERLPISMPNLWSEQTWRLIRVPSLGNY